MVNLSTGFVIDERTLASYVESGRLGGCAADCFSQTPPSGCGRGAEELWNCREALTTPNFGAWTEEVEKRLNAAVVHVVGEIVRGVGGVGGGFLGAG